MNERMIQDALHTYRVDHKVVVPNIHMPWGESDLLTVNRSGFIYDHEIKISRADFKADSGERGGKLTSITKALKHDAFKAAATLQKPLPNYFLYVSPFEMITVHDIPSYAGLLWWHPCDPHGTIQLVKKPPLPHNRKADADMMQKIARSLMFRYWNLRQKQAELAV